LELSPSIWLVTSVSPEARLLRWAGADALAKRIRRSRAGRSKVGNPRLRAILIELAWLWLRHQPQLAPALWFKEPVKRNGGRMKKTIIVALARKLLVALWKYVTAGVFIEGAVMKVA
jgi:transposase